MTAQETLADLWSLSGDVTDALGRVRLTRVEECLPSVYPVTEAATALVAATTLAAAELQADRGGSAGAVGVDGLHAAVAFQSERHYLVGGEPPPSPWDEMSGYYRARGGEWIQLHCNFPHHRRGVVEFLGVADDRSAVETAIARWDAQDLEDGLAGAGMCASRFRSTDQWAAHPHGKHVRSRPLMTIEGGGVAAVGEGTERRWVDEPGVRPLDGLRALDLSRVLAGPVCGRVLAALGADVLRVGAEHLPVIDSILPDTNLGKRFTHLDLRTDDGRERLWVLIETADVVIDGFRPGALAAAGFDRPRLWERSPALVIVELSAYGADGPWGGRRGFDSLVQTASGIGWAGMEASGAEGPTPLPAQVLDHGTGWLAAFGALRALADRRRDGKGRVIDLALARTGAWLDGLARIDGLSLAGPTPQDVAALRNGLASPDGQVAHVRLPGTIEGVSIGWDRAGSRPGADPPLWMVPH